MCGSGESELGQVMVVAYAVLYLFSAKTKLL